MDLQAVENLGRFGHHPDPAIDFCVETEVIENEWTNIKASFLNGTPTRAEVEERLRKALEFRVGGDVNAIAAKASLRAIEIEMRTSSAGTIQ